MLFWNPWTKRCRPILSGKRGSGRSGAPMMLGCLVILVGLLGYAIGVSAQTAVVLTSTDALAFDYTDTDFDTYVVSGFEVAYDGGAFAAVAAPKYQDIGGVSSYKFIPPQTNGTHTVVLRACNAVGCGAGSAPFAFAVLSSSPGTAPRNLRKVPR